MPGMYRHHVSNFTPSLGNGQAISASTTSASTSALLDVTHPEVYVFNDGAATVFVRWGVGAQTATSADMPIPSGSAQVFYKHNADTVAAITSTGTCTVRVITGLGQ